MVQSNTSTSHNTYGSPFRIVGKRACRFSMVGYPRSVEHKQTNLPAQFSLLKYFKMITARHLAAILFERNLKVAASSGEEGMKVSPPVQDLAGLAGGACAPFPFGPAILCNWSTRLLTIEITFFLRLLGELFLPRKAAT